jgi:Putative transposase/Transposase zinc-binding domain
VSLRRPEVADVIRKCSARYEEVYGGAGSQRRILRDLASCQTAALGGHKYRCDRCGHEKIAYNSCRNRHCPKCGASARAQWLEDRQRDLLSVPYFHVVFTLPEAVGPIALQNKRLVYGLLFRAVAETLLTIARDPRHLGAEIGGLAVLHTWGQNLHHHPHVHCVVPGGGLSLDGRRWVPCRQNFFLPVRVLSRYFRRQFLVLLAQAHHAGKFTFHGDIEPLSDTQNWSRWLAEQRAREWVVYAKPPFGGPDRVLKYLARYTHRVAISNQRLLSFENDQVTFLWKDYAQGNRQSTMTLDAVEFIRRFLLHALPKGFQRIRHFGFLANRVRTEKLGLCRNLLDHTQEPQSVDTSPEAAPGSTIEAPEDLCPECKVGTMRRVESIEPGSRHVIEEFVLFDTS